VGGPPAARRRDNGARRATMALPDRTLLERELHTVPIAH
jgi:hypothetical protein